jgi:hypothetical protein
MDELEVFKDDNGWMLLTKDGMPPQKVARQIVRWLSQMLVVKRVLLKRSGDATATVHLEKSQFLT